MTTCARCAAGSMGSCTLCGEAFCWTHVVKDRWGTPGTEHPDCVERTRAERLAAQNQAMDEERRWLWHEFILPRLRESKTEEMWDDRISVGTVPSVAWKKAGDVVVFDGAMAFVIDLGVQLRDDQRTGRLLRAVDADGMIWDVVRDPIHWTYAGRWGFSYKTSTWSPPSGVRRVLDAGHDYSTYDITSMAREARRIAEESTGGHRR